MSRFNDHSAESGAASDQGLSSSSMFTSLDHQYKSAAPVSNLTKNLMSSGQKMSNAAPTSRADHITSQHVHSDSSHKHMPAGLVAHSQNLDHQQTFPFPSSSSLFTSNFPQESSIYGLNGIPKLNNSMNYIPLGHNAPTIISSSYTSNHSHTPSFQSAATHLMDRSDSNVTSNAISAPVMQTHLAPNVQTGFLPSSYSKAPMGHGLPTTNLLMNSVNSSLSVFHHPHDPHRSSFSATPQLYQSQFEHPTSQQFLHDQMAQSLPTGGFASRSLHPYLQRSSLAKDSPGRITSNLQPPSLIPLLSSNPPSGSTLNFSQIHHFFAPDHYMTYDEYLEKLNKRDAEAPPTDDNGYDEHLNIVKFPVNDLITMLACLLTKIIEANDKLHPNHFDTTIAIRQKLKEEKKKKKLEKERSRQHALDSMTYSDDGINTTVEHIDDDYANSSGDEQDSEDELKNRYLANVLAFHGTNIPGITLNAYLTRVLKYCPVTNEVFLSLLVYFDRIAKKANNLKKSHGSDDDSGEAEQLFVMDSYNIHRLIILGITVSSKFFSDIFYKNLRYAKVGGLPLEELNYLELQFLLLLDFKLMISVEDLQNYGDLLLKFWKREQLAGDLVDNANKAEAESAAANT